MKNLLYLITFCLIITSCDDYIDEPPGGSITPKTIDDLGYILSSGVSGGNDILTGPRNQFLAGDDIKMTSYGINVSNYFNFYTWDSENNDPEQKDKDYDNLYKSTYFCNYVLENIDHVAEATGNIFSRDNVKGYAYFNRALNYFLLVNLYAEHHSENTVATPAVILNLSTSLTQNFKLSTVEEVYKQIFSDLEMALPLLEETTDYSFHPSKQAVYAFYSRIYLYLGDYKKALENSNLAIDEGVEFHPYKTEPYRGPKFEQPEMILFKESGVPFDADYQIDDDLYNSYAESDGRRTAYFRLGFFMPVAVFHFNITSTCGFSVPELFFTKAECLARDNKLESAKTTILEFLDSRLRVLPDISSLNKKDLISFILKERRKELVIHGLRWFDIKRLNTNETANIIITHTYRDGEDDLEFTQNPEDNYKFFIPNYALD